MIEFDYDVWMAVNCCCCTRYNYDLELSCPLDNMLADVEFSDADALPPEIAPHINMQEMCPGFSVVMQQHGPHNTHFGQGLPL